MRIYLDACCVNRLTDDQESEAIERILQGVRQGTLVWLMSDVLIEEIVRSPDAERVRENLALLALSNEPIYSTGLILSRARQLQALGYGAFDALHLACAEAGNADVLLTTDDKFERRATRAVGTPGLKVRNPLAWIKENPRDRD